MERRPSHITKRGYENNSQQALYLMFVKQGTLLDGNLLYEWTLTHTTCHVCYSRSQAICSIQDAEANYSGQEVCGRLKDKERTHTYMTCLLRGLSLRIIEELSLEFKMNVFLRQQSPCFPTFV